MLPTRASAPRRRPLIAPDRKAASNRPPRPGRRRRRRRAHGRTGKASPIGAEANAQRQWCGLRCTAGKVDRLIRPRMRQAGASQRPLARLRRVPPTSCVARGPLRLRPGVLLLGDQAIASHVPGSSPASSIRGADDGKGSCRQRARPSPLAQASAISNPVPGSGRGMAEFPVCSGATVGAESDRHPRASWRREWDSNPRYARAYNGFRDRPVRPLRHPSVVWPATS